MSDQTKNSQVQSNEGASQNGQPAQERSGQSAITKGTLKTAKRLLGYVTKTYKVQFIIVLFCILLSSIASISVSLSLKFLLDDFIIPLIGQENPDLYGTVYGADRTGNHIPFRSNCGICI